MSRVERARLCEFARTAYHPFAGVAVFWRRRRSEDNLICPACLSVYRRHEIPPRQSTCPECGSEAMDIDLVPYGQFLGKASLEDIERRRERIIAADNLLPDFKRHLKRQIGILIREKRALVRGDRAGKG